MRHQVAKDRIAIRIKPDQQLVEIQWLPPECGRPGILSIHVGKTVQCPGAGGGVRVFRCQQGSQLRSNRVVGGECRSPRKCGRKEPPRPQGCGWPRRSLRACPGSKPARHVRQLVEVPAGGREPTQCLGRRRGVDEVEGGQRRQTGTRSDPQKVGSRQLELQVLVGAEGVVIHAIRIGDAGFVVIVLECRGPHREQSGGERGGCGSIGVGCRGRRQRGGSRPQCVECFPAARILGPDHR